MQPSPTERLAWSSEIAEFLGVSTSTLDDWAYRKIGPPFFKVGGRRRYDMTEVRRWLDDKRVTTGGDAA
ncbi:MAG: helix-turn-helix domain-containing protein [Actinomycetota bacterium]